MGVKDLPLDSGERIARVFERLGFQRRRTGNHIVSDAACLGMLEARVRIELTYKGFADLSLTTWVPRPKSSDR